MKNVTVNLMSFLQKCIQYMLMYLRGGPLRYMLI